jgi:hypothetical protein
MTNPRRNPALLTRESLRAAGACYDAGDDRAGRPRRIDALFPPEGRTVDGELVAYLRKSGVPDQDIFWALNHGCPEVTDTHRRLVACACARRTLEAERAAGREPDPRSWRAVEVAERYARGEATADELAAAAAAALASACAVARAAAAAWSAACAAAAACAAEAWAAREAAEAMRADAWRFAVDTFVTIINAEEAA